MKNKLLVFFCENAAKTAQHYNIMRMILIKIKSWIIKATNNEFLI